MLHGSSTVLLHLLLLTTVAITLADNDDDNKCVFTIYIRTSSTWKAGTNSVISLRLYDSYGQDATTISDLVSWGGLMGPFHDYFERGNLDIFTGLGSCLSGPVCAMNLTSDGSGDHHGWYCNYVEVTMSESRRVESCSQEKFTVEQWLARDASPYELSAIRNNCPDFVKDRRRVVVPMM